MTFLHVMDLPAGICRVTGGSFRLVPSGEYSTGQWTPDLKLSGGREMRWAADLEFAPLLKGANGDLRFKWEAFIARLQGTVSAFRLHDPLRIRPRGAAAGVTRDNPPNGQWLIDGSYHIDGVYGIADGADHAMVRDDAPRYADVIVLSGLVPSSVALKEGDQFEVGGNLYMAIDDALSDASGHAAVRFLWKLWKPALAGDRVEFYRPSGRFVLRDLDGGTMSRSYSTGSIGLTAIEVPDAG